jgi:hypothetical protein
MGSGIQVPCMEKAPLNIVKYNSTKIPSSLTKHVADYRDICCYHHFIAFFYTMLSQKGSFNLDESTYTPNTVVK